MKSGLLTLSLCAIATFAIAQDPPPAETPPPPPPPAEAAPAGPVPIRQVQLHVWISETSEQGLIEIGNNLNYTRISENTGDSLQQVSSNVFDPNDSTFSVTLPAPDQTKFLPPLRPDLNGNLDNGVQSQSGAGLNYTLIETNHGTYEGVFRAIEQSNDVDLISKPELLVIDGRPATIHAGGEVPFQSIKFDPKGNPQLSVEFKKIGVEMRLTPIVRDPVDLVELNIESLKVTDIARVDKVRGLDLPVIAERSQKGHVLLPSNQTVVIGGLSSQVSRTSERRVPVLGKIPVFGTLFRGRSSEFDVATLLILVQPTVVDLRAMTAEASGAMQFWQDGSWDNEQAIADEIALMDVEF